MWQWTQKPQKFVINGKARNWIIHGLAATFPLFQKTNQSNRAKKKKTKPSRTGGRWMLLAWDVLRSSTGRCGLIPSLLKYSWRAIRCLWPPSITRDLQSLNWSQEGEGEGVAESLRKKKRICSESRITFYCRRVFWVQGREVWEGVGY